MKNEILRGQRLPGELVDGKTIWKEHYRSMKAYEECLSATSTEDAPRHVVPADSKKNARLIVSRIILDAYPEMEIAHPKTTAKRWLELKEIRKRL